MDGIQGCEKTVYLEIQPDDVFLIGMGTLDVGVYVKDKLVNNVSILIYGPDHCTFEEMLLHSEGHWLTPAHWQHHH